MNSEPSTCGGPVRDAKSILYVTYDGLCDPLGRSQVLPYLEGLAKLGCQITILSCEKAAARAKGSALVQKICDDAGIVWHPLSYHKRPPILSTVMDSINLTRVAAQLHRRRNFDIVHCRSYIPAMAGLHLKRRHGTRFLFDMRGFWPDEKVEGNNWPQSQLIFRLVYRFFKRLEVKLLANADHIISLTREGKRQMLGRTEVTLAEEEITVIPCCVDFSHFPLVDAQERQAARTLLGLSAETRVVAYLGSLGAWYMLDEMLDFFKVYAGCHAGARFLLVTHDDADFIASAARDRGIDPAMLIIRPAQREEVPKLMAAADVGIFFIQPVFSKKASSPTKMGEMLALGLPLVTNSGVGDVGEIVEDTDCGVAIGSFDEASYEAAIDRLQSTTASPEERRARALPWFDVKLGIEQYERVYRNLGALQRDE